MNNDINEMDKRGQTQLSYAASKGNLPAVRSLLKCPDIKVDRPAYNGFTPLMLAVRCNHLEIVQVLLENGANVNAKNVFGNTVRDFIQKGVTQQEDESAYFIEALLASAGAQSGINYRAELLGNWGK